MSTGDGYGHGNHVSGIIAGSGKNSTGAGYDYKVRGIAPNVKLVSLRALDKSGHGNDSAVIAAIQRAIDLKATYNIRILNLSLGRGVFESASLDPLCQAVQK
jgi:serine protease AprX